MASTANGLAPPSPTAGVASPSQSHQPSVSRSESVQPSTNGINGTHETNGTNGLSNDDHTAPLRQPQQPVTNGTAHVSDASVTATLPASNPAAPRPRDVRLIELLLSSSGVTAYEPRVPLALLDFAYRHTSSILTDAMHHSFEHNATTHSKSATAGTGAATGEATATHSTIKLAIASRLNYQYRGGSIASGVSKDLTLEMAERRNRIALPRVGVSEWGIRVPNERFVLTGASWGLRADGWDEDDSETMDDEESEAGVNGVPARSDTIVDEMEEDEEDDDEEELGEEDDQMVLVEEGQPDVDETMGGIEVVVAEGGGSSSNGDGGGGDGDGGGVNTPGGNERRGSAIVEGVAQTPTPAPTQLETEVQAQVPDQPQMEMPTETQSDMQMQSPGPTQPTETVEENDELEEDGDDEPGKMEDAFGADADEDMTG